MTIRILHGDKIVYSIKGGEQSEFLLIDKIFYYADFRSDAPGGSIIAVDLATGKELWRWGKAGDELERESDATSPLSAMTERQKK